MAVAVMVRARLRGTPAEAKKLHDEVTGATKAMAKQAGDLAHKIYLDPRDPKAFLGIDTWSSIERFQQLASSQQIRDFFGKRFEGEPEVHVRVDSDWDRW